MPLPGDWSFGNLKSKVGGLLTDPQQQMGLLSNPMFRAGMGILSENSKPFGGDKFGAALAGIAGAQGNKQEQDDRERLEQLRQQLAALIAAQQGGGGVGPQGYPMSPVPGQTPPIAGDQTQQLLQKLGWRGVIG